MKTFEEFRQLSESSGKYEFTTEKMKFKGKVLYRIKALKSFGNVKAGMQKSMRTGIILVAVVVVLAGVVCTLIC
jgi:hypothetical protein